MDVIRLVESAIGTSVIMCFKIKMSLKKHTRVVGELMPPHLYFSCCAYKCAALFLTAYRYEVATL